MSDGVNSRERAGDLTGAFPRLLADAGLSTNQVGRLNEDVAGAREFVAHHVRPVALELDRVVGDDPRHFPHEIVTAGLSYGMQSLSLPAAAGGRDGSLILRNALVMEELSAGCSGVATIFGAHALGIAPLLVAGPLFWDGVLREIADSERRGEALLMGCAITEPAAGTDVENPELLERARLAGHAQPVDGGYLISGVKHFISNGNVAGWLTVCVPTDVRKPRETMACFLVDTKSTGFSVGRVEHKMGQRACPAAELVFDEVFVPESGVVCPPGDGAFGTMLVLAASRPVVGAIATGIARGAYERLREWLLGDLSAGRLLDNQQVQIALAEMDADIHAARQLYMDAATEIDCLSLGRMLRDPSVWALAHVPRRIRRSRVMTSFMRSELAHQATIELMRKRIGDRGLTRAVAMSSMAKAHCADTAMRVTTRALDIAGLDSGGVRQELEKCWRDAKLTQIYEGTNQLNRLESYRGRVAGETCEMMPRRQPLQKLALGRR